MAAGVILGLAACSEPQATLPPPPDSPDTTEEYPFGTLTGSLDTRYWTQVWDRAETRFGERDLRLERFVMPPEITWQSLRDHYRTRLTTDGGWQAANDLVFGQNEHAWSFAFQRDDAFIALVGLQPVHSEDGRVPVNLITNLPSSDGTTPY